MSPSYIYARNPIREINIPLVVWAVTLSLIISQVGCRSDAELQQVREVSAYLSTFVPGEQQRVVSYVANGHPEWAVAWAYLGVVRVYSEEGTLAAFWQWPPESPEEVALVVEGGRREDVENAQYAH